MYKRQVFILTLESTFTASGDPTVSETSHTRVSTVRTRSQIPRRHTHGRAATRHVSHPVHRECDEKSLHELLFHIHRLHRFTASLACTSCRETRVAWLASQPVLSMPSADVRCLPPTSRGAISSGDLFYITSAVVAAKGVRQLADRRAQALDLERSTNRRAAA